MIYKLLLLLVKLKFKFMKDASLVSQGNERHILKLGLVLIYPDRRRELFLEAPSRFSKPQLASEPITA